jgi:uncharacterized protein (TIGR03437 family)
VFRLVTLILGLTCGAWAQSVASGGVGPLYTLRTIAGSGPQDQSQAFRPETLAFDAAGNLYLGDIRGRVYRVAPSGSMVAIAGPGVAGFSADGTNGTFRLGSPLGVAADASGSVYIADTSHNRVLKLTRDGTVTAFAGIGTAGSTGDDGPALSAQINQPYALAVDRQGNVYIGEYGGARVRKVTPDGIISTVAGNGQFGTAGDGGPATSAQIADMGIAVDRIGSLYIADGVSLVRKVDPDGTISTVAGGGTALGPQEGVRATAAWLFKPNAVAVDAAGNLYIADGWRNQVREVTPDGMIHTVAGFGTAGYLLGPGRDAASSQLSYPTGVALDAGGNLYIADFGNSAVRKVDTHGKISLYASGPIGDGGPATAVVLVNPTSVAVDAHENIYVNDGSGRIRRIDREGIVTTFAGNGEQGFAADGVPAVTTPLNSPGQISIGPAGDLFIADTGNHRVRKVGADGIVTTVAGTGKAGFSGDGGPAGSAQLSSPSGVAVDNAGNFYIADTANQRIRKVDTGGTITTLAAKETAGYGVYDGRAPFPISLAVDSIGNVYIADTGGVSKISPDGTIRVPAASASPPNPAFSVALDPDGNLFIASDRIRRVRPDGVMDTVAGWGGINPYFQQIGSPAAALDGLPAFLGPLSPRGISVDSSGNLYIAEGNGFLRKGSVLRSASGPPKLLPRAVVNAANSLPWPVAPGELVTLFGADLGPAAEVSARPDASGRFAASLAGVRVLFDRVPAPVLYAQNYQVNAIVPFSVTPGSTVEVRVEYNGAQSNAASIEIAEAAPAIFTLDSPSPAGGRAAALDQDGPINSPVFPAPVGSILTLYVTGAGVMQPAIPDGQVVTTTNAKPVLPVFVSFGGFMGEVLYAGPAPGIVAGVLQINVRVPDVLCCSWWQFPVNRNAISVSVGLGQPDVGTYRFAKYFSSVLTTVAVK